MNDAAPTTTGSRSGVQVIARAGAILRAIGAEGSGLSLSEIVAATGLAKSTVYRIVLALEAEQLLESHQGRYRVGVALGGEREPTHAELRRCARPYLERLANRVHETVDLGVVSGDCVLFIDQVRWERELAAGVIVGALYPLHACASGKALLAASPPLTERVLQTTLARATPNTISDSVQLGIEVTQTARRGIAFDQEENHRGISGIATSVTIGDGRAVSVGIPLPSVRYEDRRDELAQALIEIRSELAGVL